MKERYALTEFRKQANRMNFGDVSIFKFNFDSLICEDFYFFIFFLYRLKKMLIKKIQVIAVEQLVKLVLVEYVYHKLMKKQKYELVKHYKKIYKNNKFMVVVQQYVNKYLVQHQVLHLHHCKVQKLLTHRLLRNQMKQMQNIFQKHLDFYQLEKEQHKN